MPLRCSLRMVVRVWQERAKALRRWWYWMRLAVLSYRRSRARGSSCQLWTSASVATRTWQTVHSRFFPPQPLAGFGQEQIAHGGQNQMAFQAEPAAAFPMIQSNFSFAVLKATFDAPAAERHAQQLLHRRVRRSVAQEVFNLACERVVAHEQVIWPLRQPLFVFDMDQDVLDVPDQRTFLGVLDSPCLPRLSGQCRVRLSQMLDRLGLGTTSHQAWNLPRSAPLLPVKGSLRNPRRLDPSRENLGDFAHKLLAAGRERSQKRRLAAIPFVERQPLEMHSVRVWCGRTVPRQSSSWGGKPLRREFPPDGTACDPRSSSPAETNRRRASSESLPSCSPNERC